VPNCRRTNSQGRVVVVSGPSGAGKTSVMRRLYQHSPLPLVQSVSATTRPPRPEETDGVDYHFLSDEAFERRRRRGEFLECYQVFHQAYWYGTLWSAVLPGLAAGKWVVLGIDVHGAQAVRERFADAITIFVRPSSREELCRRLRARGTESEDAIARRLAVADEELADADQYQYQVVNDDLDQAVREISAILTKEWENSRHD
jgi:guanylate kinase